VFSDVVATPLGSGAHRLRFQDRWNNQVWYEPEQVSDGSMLVLAFLTLQYQQPSVDVIAIEEPEHSLHPYLVGEVVQMLRKLAHGELGPKKTHVVVTTHSPEVLQFAQPDEVRFLNRQSDGSVVISQPPTGTPQWEQAFEEYRRDLGSIWLSGGLGGVPSG
jgi:predicted ATPase